MKKLRFCVISLIFIKLVSLNTIHHLEILCFELDVVIIKMWDVSLKNGIGVSFMWGEKCTFPIQRTKSKFGKWRNGVWE